LRVSLSSMTVAFQISQGRVVDADVG